MNKIPQLLTQHYKVSQILEESLLMDNCFFNLSHQEIR